MGTRSYNHCGRGRGGLKEIGQDKIDGHWSGRKKYEGWVKGGVEFFNNQVQELQIVRKTAVSKRMEEEYLQKKKKRSFQVSALNGLVAVKEVVVVGHHESDELQSSIPNTVTYPSGMAQTND
jgi:hypothetical protein